MSAQRSRYIADLLQIHAEDLAFLWGQRREALGSRRHTLRQFNEINERIEAHAQGLLVAPPDALSDLLRPGLSSIDRDDAFAAAYGLLRLEHLDTTKLVLVEFSRAAGASLAGLRDALGFATPTLFSTAMQSALDQAKPITAASAAVVLAHHRMLDAGSTRLADLLQEDEAAVCELSWRAALVSDALGSRADGQRPYAQGIAHAAPAVRKAAWSALAWSGDPQTLPLLRQTAATGDQVAVHWLAVLGTQDDAPWLKQAVLAIENAQQRCELLARFGHPMVLNALLRWMKGDDVAQAAAAGEAFTRITGIDVRGERRALPVPDNADEFDREMAPDVWMPDAEKARSLVERHGTEWSAGHRWCNGIRLDLELSRETLQQLDFEARWDAAARAALAGRRISAPPPIH
jgi:uncharacterized protein (TIGR02270 family)